MTTNIAKYTELTLAGIAGAGLAFATGSALGIGVATKFLLEGEPLHAASSFLFTVCNQELRVLNATRLELSKTNYSVLSIIQAAL